MANFCSSLFHRRRRAPPEPVEGAAAAVGGDDEPARLGIARSADLLPPAPDAVDGEGCRVVVDTEIDPAVVGGQVIDPVGDGAAQFRDQEVVGPNLFGIAARAPFAARVLEVPDQFLLLGIDRDDRLPLGQGGAHRAIEVGELGIAIGMLVAS